MRVKEGENGEWRREKERVPQLADHCSRCNVCNACVGANAAGARRRGVVCVCVCLVLGVCCVGMGELLVELR
jgi:hypothetical protein